MYLSINDERLVSQFCQLITCFCIHYNLEDNIGISIEKLSKYGVNLTKKRNEISPETRNSRLLITFNYLFAIKQNKREHIDLIKSYFYLKYIHDIICALIQIIYSPFSNLSQEDKEKFLKWLEIDLFDEADGANIVSNLIMAQGTSKLDWFTNQIGKMLTKCLLRPNSVMNVVRAVLTEINAVSTVTLASDWKKCDIVAKILAQCPKEINIEDYIKFLAPQILNLFFAYDQRFAKHFYRVSGSVYSLFSLRWPDLTREYLTKPILNEIYPGKSFKLDSKKFKEYLEKIHLVYVSSTEPSWSTLNQLPNELVFLLFKVYVQISGKINCKKSKETLEDLLKLYVRLRPKSIEFLTRLLNETLLRNDFYYLNFESYEDDESEEEENILIEYPKDSFDIITIQMVEKHCKGVLDLIQAVNDTQLKVDFMIYLFSAINESILENSKLNSDSKTDKTLLKMEFDFENKSKQINLRIIYFTQLSLLFESLDPEIIVKNYVKIIEFCRLILENFLKLINQRFDLENSETDKNNYEIIHLILSVISVFTTGLIELDYECKKLLQVLIPLILEVKVLYTGTELENMSQSLHVSIATYLGVKTENQIKKEKVLIQELDDYDLTIKDVNDPLIPVKAHGLVQLRKLIELKNEKCIQNKENLIDLVIRNLKNEDSYVYLAAIQCLISLIDLEPNRILNILIEEYLCEKNKLDIENRLKIGEVLTKTVRNFNELVPSYGPKLINTFLVGAKNQDEMIRSSSLSNLGETCKLLNFSLANNIYEIINCLSSLLDTDNSLQVKRAAILVLKMIVEGLKKRVLFKFWEVQ